MVHKNGGNGRGKGNDHKTEQPSLTPSQQELLKQTSQKVDARQRDGTIKSVTISEALTQQHIQAGLKGSSHALNQVNKRLEEAERIEADVNQCNIEIGHKIKQNLINELEEFKEQLRHEGLSDKEIDVRAKYFIPHPDDFVIHDKGYQLGSPFDEESLEIVKSAMQLRDAYWLQHELDERHPCVERTFDLEQIDEEHVMFFGRLTPEFLFTLRSGWFNANMLEMGIPKRFQRTDREQYRMDSNLRRYTKRDLLKECYQMWKQIGHQRPRGWLSPPFEQAVYAHHLTQTLTSQIKARTSEANQSTDREMIELIKEVQRQVETEMRQ